MRLDDIDPYVITAPDNSVHIGLLVTAASPTGHTVRFYYDGQVYGSARGYGYSLAGSAMSDWLEQLAQDRLVHLVPSVRYHYHVVQATKRHTPRYESTHTDRIPRGLNGLVHHAYGPSTAHPNGITIARVDTAGSVLIALAREAGYDMRAFYAVHPRPYVKRDFAVAAR